MYYNIYKKTIPNLMPPRTLTKQTLLQAQKDAETVIETIANSINEIQDLTEANTYLESFVKNNELFTRLDSNAYKYKDYYINVGKKHTLARQAEGLRDIKYLKLTSAPDLIAYSELKNKNDCILITKIADTENCQLLPYSNIASDISIEAKQKFLSDIDKLYETGQVNIDFINKGNWYVIPSTNRIILSNWSDFANCNDEIAKSNFKKKVSQLCSLIY